MKKLKLDPEHLRVDTFTPRGVKDAPRGTVRGHETDIDCQPSGIHYQTCGVSCVWMCLHTEEWTCTTDW